MKYLSFTLIAVAALFVSTSYAPHAQASRLQALTTDYYDSNQVNVGTSFWDCSGPQQNWGTLAGEWKEIQVQSCETGSITLEEYQFCGGSWVRVDYIFETVC